MQAGPKQETVFGLDLENPWFVAALIRFGRITLPVLFLVAIVATVLDVGEVMRQIGEAKSMVAALALLVLTRSTQRNTVQSI